MRVWSLALILTMAGCKSKSEAPAPCHNCNFVLITVDTLRRDHTTPTTMPRATEFFRRGSAFERATSPSPCTLPAVQQLLTGTIDAVDGAPRLAETLASRGYRTAAFVSQHFLRNHEGPLPKFARGYQTFDIQDHDELDHHGMTRRRAEEVSDRGIAWLDGLGDDDRFHLWLHYFDPHDPYTPPTVKVPDGSVHPGDRRVRQCGGKLRRGGCERRGRAAGQPLFSPEETRELVALYDAEISYVDEHVGRVLEALKERSQNSVVVLTSDHGERLGADGRWDHCQSLHRWEIDVPLLMTVQDRPLATDPSANVSTLDIVPTIHGLLALGPVATDGLDLRALPANRRVVTVWQDQHLVMGGDWKLFVDAKSARLVHTGRDPAERRDLSSAEPAVRAEMIREVQELSDRYRAAQDESEAIVERLRAIGYIQ